MSAVSMQLKNSLLATGESQSAFARSAGVSQSNVAGFIHKYAGLKRGRSAQKIIAEMEKRGWTQESVIEKAFTSKKVSPAKKVKRPRSEGLTVAILDSNLSPENKCTILRRLA